MLWGISLRGLVSLQGEAERGEAGKDGEEAGKRREGAEEQSGVRWGGKVEAPPKFKGHTAPPACLERKTVPANVTLVWGMHNGWAHGEWATWRWCGGDMTGCRGVLLFWCCGVMHFNIFQVERVFK